MTHPRLSTTLAVLACLCGGPAVRAQPVTPATSNWMREYVDLRTRAFTERHLPRTLRSDMAAGTPRIIGGSPVTGSEHPFQVALLMKSQPSNSAAQFCGGTLVKPDLVVTAAHCSDFVTAAQVQVLTGTRNLGSGGTRRNVVSIRIHPGWTPSTFNNDVAVWKLSSSAMGIPLASLASSEGGVGTRMFTSGWGITESGNPSAQLRGVEVPLVSRTNCNDANSYNGAVSTAMICAGFNRGGRDSCQGDSGGPLTKVATGRRELTGITSWGNGCALPNLFGIYTRVSSPTIRNFILSQLGVAQPGGEGVVNPTP